MAIEQKGMLSPFTLFTSIITGGFFPLLGSFFATLFIDKIYWTGVLLTSFGGFQRNVETGLGCQASYSRRCNPFHTSTITVIQRNL